MRELQICQCETYYWYIICAATGRSAQLTHGSPSYMTGQPMYIQCCHRPERAANTYCTGHGYHTVRQVSQGRYRWRRVVELHPHTYTHRHTSTGAQRARRQGRSPDQRPITVHRCRCVVHVHKAGSFSSFVSGFRGVGGGWSY